MLTLSPAKILVVLVVALIVLGPEKLPGLARQMGAAWGDLRRFRSRLESEVRGVFPDLPPAHEVAQAVRSPLAFLDRLADEHERTRDDGPATVTAAADGAASPEASGDAPSTPAAAPGDAPPTNGQSASSSGPPANGARSHGVPTLGGGVAPDAVFPGVVDDPSMN